jgi:hypothetical protein
MKQGRLRDRKVGSKKEEGKTNKQTKNNWKSSQVCKVTISMGKLRTET